MASENHKYVSQDEITHYDMSQPFKALLMTLNDLIADYLSEKKLHQVSITLSQASSFLVDGYALWGLDPELPANEVTQGIDDCDAAIAILKDQNAELDLTAAELHALSGTIESMREELSDDY